MLLLSVPCGHGHRPKPIVLCPPCSIAWYREQSAFPFPALSCHPAAIARFHPLKLPHNGNHAVRTKGRAQREKQCKSSGKAAAAAAAGLTLFSRAPPGWALELGPRTPVPFLSCFPIITADRPRAGTGRIWAAPAPRPTGNSSVFPAQASCRRKGELRGWGRESLLLQEYCSLSKTPEQLAGHP